MKSNCTILIGLEFRVMNSEDVRWKQRFQNFEKTMGLLSLSLEINNPDVFQKAGIIQFFEMSVELAWNLFKDYLQDQGFSEIRSPRDSIKKAFETGIIEDGHLWLLILENRNKTSHTYDESMAESVINEIKKSFFPLLSETLSFFRSKV